MYITTHIHIAMHVLYFSHKMLPYVYTSIHIHQKPSDLVIYAV